MKLFYLFNILFLGFYSINCLSIKDECDIIKDLISIYSGQLDYTKEDYCCEIVECSGDHSHIIKL